MTVLAVKILLSPLCVVAVSLAGRRWGIAIAGVLGGLPVVAGPILLVETLLHGRGFGADAAAGAIAGRGRRLLRARPKAAATDAPATARHRRATLVGPFRPRPRRARARSGADRSIGCPRPHLSGLLAPFPIITSVLAVFTHAHDGPAQVSVLLRNFLFGFYGFAAFCFMLAVTLPALSITLAYGLATVSALAVQATTFVLRSRLGVEGF